jgi:hypothetical protein
VLLFIGCSNKKTKIDSKNTNVDQINNLPSNDLSISEKEDKNVLNIGETSQWNSTILFQTVINDDNVNVRAYPSLNADILYKVNTNAKITVIGTSMEIDNIDNYTSNWFYIVIGGDDYWKRFGWVFGKYIEIDQITVSKIQITEITTEKYSPKLLGFYQINGNIKEITLYPYEKNNKNFYTFIYDYAIENFHYSNIPGTYIWYPETNELKHISYVGQSEESAWAIITDDFKYIIQDFGTGPGIRGLGVWRADNAKKIFSGTYDGEIYLKENTISIVYVYNNWNISHDFLDNEIINYAKKYKEDNPVPDSLVERTKEMGGSIELMINCKLDLDTGNREIKSGEYFIDY